ncbi:MAG: hypothetical protein HC827_09100 [Cyanobacteria bacterium RM1_2_2]|nr:hypothetical protein [Cyanobacteria bacterium RM1_2_2]
MSFSLSALQHQFLTELFDLCSRYQRNGVVAMSMGTDRRFYIVKVELVQLAQCNARD